VLPDPEWLSGFERAFVETGADYVAGRILPIWEVPPPVWMSPALFGVLAVPDNGTQRLAITADGSSAVMPIGANMAVRGSVVSRLGGLRTDLGKLDELGHGKNISWNKIRKAIAPPKEKVECEHAHTSMVKKCVDCEKILL